jgi:hypothetical protein
MLSINEIMVGDWVYITDYPMKKEAKQVKPEHLLRSLVTFEPIPLTPEILKKNGFETHPSNLRMFLAHDDYRLCYYLNSSNHFTSFNNIDGSLVQKVIVNVHELQHVLKICGIDKEIIL